MLDSIVFDEILTAAGAAVEAFRAWLSIQIVKGSRALPRKESYECIND